MHPIEPSRVLNSSVQQVLETMCFTQASPITDAKLEEPVIGRSVVFGGTNSGFLALQVGTQTADWLTASLLGQTLKPADPLSEATVSELAQVICGRFLSLLNPSATLDIQPSARCATIGKAATLHWQTFQLDCGLLRIAYEFSSRAVS